MNNFYLPTLKSIKLRNFSLYPNGLDFEYKFVEGVNLIIGGNGVGKTTFLNLIRYGIIGLYKKETDIRTREEKRIEKRINLPYDYFKNRMDNAYPSNESAEIILVFSFNKSTFTVTRSLYDITLKAVKIEEEGITRDLDGKVLTQKSYDYLLRFNPEQINDTLQKKFEDEVGSASNLQYFDNLIFLVNEILFFGENRKTIVWERDRKEESSIQSKLSSKYFNDPKLDNLRAEAERNAKYYDSLSRHFSEDIRAITKVIDQIKDTDKLNKSFKESIQLIDKQKIIVTNIESQIQESTQQRSKSEMTLNELYSKRNTLGQKITELEHRKLTEEELIHKEIWQKLHPKYHEFLKYIKNENGCPLCNQDLSKSILTHIISHESNCMLCGNEINNPKTTNSSIQTISTELNNLLIERSNTEKEIYKIETVINNSDRNFTEIRIKHSNALSKLRRLEHSFQIKQSSIDDNTDFEFKAMKSRIDELELEKQKNQELSKQFRAKVIQIDAQIDEQRLEVRSELSKAFSDYASQFLGVECELVYDEFGDGLNKRYLPKIAGSVRKDEEELSESQRFFIDQSFRMCLLNYFYTSPTFFMCETPDSSLDISYEHNAAKIFLKYLEKPNSLIITSNLNNSEFLDFIIDRSNSIGFINLLKIGRRSNIQATSNQLNQASNRIEEKIYAKYK